MRKNGFNTPSFRLKSKAFLVFGLLCFSLFLIGCTDSDTIIVNRIGLVDGNLSVDGNVDADYFFGSGEFLTDLNCVDCNVGSSSDTNIWTEGLLDVDNIWQGDLNITGILDAVGGGIFRGLAPEELYGFDNIRLGVYFGTPRITFENSGSLWEIDNVGPALRIVDGIAYEAVTRFFLDYVKIGEAGHRVDLNVWGDIETFDPAGGGGNLKVEGKISSGQTTCSASSDHFDVLGVNSILVDSSGGDIVLGGLSGGVAGQILLITHHTLGHTLTLEANEATGTQKFRLIGDSDESLDSHGGWTLICDGTDWFGGNHAKHI